MLFCIFLSSSISVMAQVDTFAFYNIPRYYYMEDSFDYEHFTLIRYYDKMQCDYGGSVWGTQVFSIGVPYCVGQISQHWFFGHDYWNKPNIDWFAVGVHADTSIRVAGVAMIYPRQKFNSSVITDIRADWGAHGCDRMLLQLMDTTMDVQTEGAVALENPSNKVFLINSIPNRQEMNTEGGRFPNPLDIYEAWFPEPITVSDSFYLALRLVGSDGFHSVPVPAVYEIISNYRNVIGPLLFDYPLITWKAHGKYRHSYNGSNIVVDSVEEPCWFTYTACQEPHGYMLIFPILAEDCGVHGEVSWTATGGGDVRLRWNPGSWDSEWEVSYGPSGTLPGDSAVITTTATSAILHGIVPGTHYVAYIRSQCTVRDTTWSDWTDSISIFIPAPDPEGIAAIEARAGVTLQPNPATSTALLTAAVPLASVEVYSAAGALCQRLPATGLSATLDVSSWPSGTYLLLIDTEAGTVSRRLVVTH